MTEEDFNEMEQAERQKHDDKVKESKQKSLEQIAEEYADEVFAGNDKDSTYYRSILICAYKDGYKAGQKETDSYYQNEVDEMSDSYSERLKTLQQDVERQKGFYNQLKAIYNEEVDKAIQVKNEKKLLEKNYTELQKKYDELNDFSNSQCAKLLKQIEKMKCCSNCDNGLRNGLLCDRQIECRKNNNKLWKLAE